MNIIKTQFFKDAILELIKAAMTFIFGYISFKLFQRYKNNKDNNRLYIKIIKLEKELNENKDNIEKVLDEYIEKEILEKEFYINEEYSEELYTLYYDIEKLELSYYIEDPVYEYGEIVDMSYTYIDTPSKIIAEMANYECGEYRSYDEIKNSEKELEYYQNKNIYDDFLELEDKLYSFLHKNFKLHESTKFLYVKVKKFNSLLQNEKKMYLNNFCRLIFEEENKFTVALEKFRKLRKLKLKLDNIKKCPKLKLNFSLWKRIDIDLLAVYSAETYLILEELYLKLDNLEIDINNEKIVKEIYSLLVNKLEPIIVQERDKLKKILLRTNRLFSGI